MECDTCLGVLFHMSSEFLSTIRRVFCQGLFNVSRDELSCLWQEYQTHNPIHRRGGCPALPLPPLHRLGAESAGYALQEEAISVVVGIEVPWDQLYLCFSRGSRHFVNCALLLLVNC